MLRGISINNPFNNYSVSLSHTRNSSSAATFFLNASFTVICGAISPTGAAATSLSSSKAFNVDADGKRYGDIRKTLNKVCKRAGVEWLRFHDLTHTFASHLVMAGVDINTASKL
jgi:hypothetical protein